MTLSANNKILIGLQKSYYIKAPKYPSWTKGVTPEGEGRMEGLGEEGGCREGKGRGGVKRMEGADEKVCIRGRGGRKE